LTFDTVLKVEDKELKLSSIVDRKSCEKFLLSYIESKHKIENVQRLIKNLNTLLNEINFEDIMKKKRNISFIYIEINNILVYGKDVNIDIEKINGIVGICETNSSGKSTLCEIISLVLFGKTPRCNTGFSFIRNGQKESSCSISLISNGTEYEITRMFSVHYKEDKKVNTTFIIKKIINKKKGQCIKYVKKDLFSQNLYKKSKEDDIVFKSDSDMAEIINKEIITYDELYQMIVISQNREKSFLEEEGKEKNNLLFKMANLSFLNDISNKSDELYKNTRRDIKSMLTSHCSKEFTKDCKKDPSHTQLYEHSKNILNEFETEIKEYDLNKDKKDKELYEKYITKNNELVSINERMNIYNEFKEIDDEYNIEELNDENEDYEDEIKEKKKSIKDLDNKIIDYNNKIKDIKKELGLKKYKNIEDKNKEFQENKKQTSNNIKKNILELNKNIKDVKYKDITKKDYNNYLKNVKVLNEKINIDKENLDIYKKHNKNINSIEHIKNIISEYDKYIQLIDNKNKIIHELEFIDNYKTYLKQDNATKKYILDKKTKYNKELEIMNDQINNMNDIKESYEQIKLNKNYDEEIDELENDISIDEDKKILLDKKISDYLQNEQNSDYNKQIKVLEDKLNEEDDKTFDDYDTYNDLNDNLNKYEKELTSIKYNREILLNKINTTESYLKENKDILNVIDKNQENYNKYLDTKKKLDKIKKEFNIIEKEYNDNTKLLQEKETKINDLKEKCIIAKNIINKCTESIEDLKDFELLVNILKTNGLCDKLLEEQIVVNLQKALDDICTYINHEKIYIDLVHTNDNTTKKFYIIIRTDKIKDIANAGGFQRNIMELIFKVAFLRINSYLKSDFIIIDELFDACSEENKSMAIKLVEYYKTQFNKILLVSHNQSIINLFDKRLIITHDDENGNSIVQN
jgi:exonuclease SbcC